MTDHLPGEPGPPDSQGPRGFFVRLLSMIGLFFGAGQASATGELIDLQQTGLRQDAFKALSPEVLAAGVVKGHLDLGEAVDEARDAGINGARFRAMVDITGNPPGPGQLITMLRRRIIDRARVVDGIKQGLIKVEWADAILALEHDPISVADAVQAAVQNHLSKDEAAQIAEANGIAPQGFEILYENAGNPPGPMETLNLWVRGYITEAEVDQALRESRLKDKWIEPLKNLAHHKVPMRTITTLLNHGAITDARAAQMLKELGFSDEDGAAIIKAAHHVAAAPHKELSASSIASLYQDRVMSRDDAVNELVGLGYNATAAAQTLDLADSRAKQRLRTAAITKLRSVYVAHRMTDHDATLDLDALGVPGDQRDYMLELWRLERDANVATLTPSDIAAAGKLGLLDKNEVVSRLVALGYSTDDAVLYGMVHKAIALPTTTASP